MEASEEDRQKITELIKAGRIEWSDQGKKYFERAGVIKTVNPDWGIVDVSVSFWGKSDRNQGGMEISWSTVSAGFGGLTVFVDKDGKLKADTECMSKDFCKSVLIKLIDSWENA